MKISKNSATSAIPANPILEVMAVPLHTVASGMLTAELSGIIQAVNPPLKKMLQRKAQDLCGSPLWSLVIDEDKGRVQRLLEQVVAGQDSGQEIPVRMNHNEAAQPVEASLYLSLLLRQGQPPLVQGVVINRTLRLQQDLRDNLAREKFARTGRLIALGEMASSIAHEINQPLTAIATLAQACGTLLKSGKTIDVPQMIELAQDVTEQALRAAQVVRRIRDFVTKRDLSREFITVDALLNSVAPIVAPELHAGGVQMEIALPTPPLKVLVDVIHLEQVCLNLIRNAIEAMRGVPPGTRVLTIFAHRAGENVVITFDDRGPGVPLADRERLFEPFFTSKADGMGLGLSTSQGIVQAHGGNLLYETNPAGGARFVMVLPTT